jgi:hypothetical protein
MVCGGGGRMGVRGVDVQIGGMVMVALEHCVLHIPSGKRSRLIMWSLPPGHSKRWSIEYSADGFLFYIHIGTIDGRQPVREWRTWCQKDAGRCLRAVGMGIAVPATN